MIAVFQGINFVCLYRESCSSTLATVALLTAAIGFGSSWLVHRNVAGRMLLPYRGPVKTVATFGAKALCENDLAVAESECPGPSRAIVLDSPNLSRNGKLTSLPACHRAAAAAQKLTPAARGLQGRY